MFRVAVLLSLASVLLTALALISCLSVEDKRQIRGMPRFAWVLAILLLPLVGASAWFLFGRPLPPGKSGWSVAPARPQARRPAPDDDPEFLRSLGGSTGKQPKPKLSKQEEEELLRRWEEDLQRREGKPRPRDPGTEP
ncbi:MAG TPA: PLD nuclease N-terminal domain-containing protein [Natronosporangium sp.]